MTNAKSVNNKILTPFPVATHKMGKISTTMAESLKFMYMIILLSQSIHTAAYTLTPSQSVSDGQTLTSKGGKFELGFFSPSSSNKNRFLAIWYKRTPAKTAVWVANRETPVPDTSGVLKIDTRGNIVILNKTDSIIWSSNSSGAVENPFIEFLESGNLVVREAMNGDPKSYIWQSFDYPGNTLLPGMKLGWNLQTGKNKYISSWRNSDDPSRGEFTLGLETESYPETMIRKGSIKYYRGGLWNGIQYAGAPDLWPNSIFTYDFIQNDEEISVSYQLINQSVIMRYTILQTGAEGRLESSIWDDNANSWTRLQSIPRDRCDEYAVCGVYSTCELDKVLFCQCLQGFEQVSLKEWSPSNLPKGCQREIPLKCSNGEGFRQYNRVKLPETISAMVNGSLSLEECKVMCLNNCTCMAYANSNITEGGSGCIMWFTDLIDIKQFTSGGQDLYVRMAVSELESEDKSGKKRSLTVIVSVTSVAGIVVLGFASWCFWRKKDSKGVSERDDFELPLYSLQTISTAANNFSSANKLGEGGFGPVYKGILEDGQEIAVKRLSKDSTQGVDAFKNEVILISKLQHKNLVRLLGCCIEGKEKILVYEYMPKNSLDSLIFDETKKKDLDWKQRFAIIQGVAAGLLYLHHDSRLRIIHRDLKASNVLLDSELVPKISDFGMARMFGSDQLEAKTNRVVGTYGYMSPEYLIEGHFSTKSDVFSFGVLVLEIISGKKNWGFHDPEHEFNLLGHAWTLCSAGKSSELVDPSMRNSRFDQDILRCIHIGLLCVQIETEDRPTMSSVVTMLSSEIAVLPKPQPPGFYFERTLIPSKYFTNKNPPSSNKFTITLVEER